MWLGWPRPSVVFGVAMAFQDWVPAAGDRVRLRHNWPANDLVRGDVGTVVDVLARALGESWEASAERWRAHEPPFAIEVRRVIVRWDRHPDTPLAAVPGQLEPSPALS